MCTIILKNHHF